MNIIEWMIENKIADNNFQASNISKGLHLPLFEREQQEKLCLLYRKWRKDSKSDLPSWQAYQLSLSGIDPDDVEPRQIALFCGCKGKYGTIRMKDKVICSYCMREVEQ